MSIGKGQKKSLGPKFCFVNMYSTSLVTEKKSQEIHTIYDLQCKYFAYGWQTLVFLSNALILEHFVINMTKLLDILSNCLDDTSGVVSTTCLEVVYRACLRPTQSVVTRSKHTHTQTHIVQLLFVCMLFLSFSILSHSNGNVSNDEERMLQNNVQS